jgi:hypothetical protein
MGGGCGGAAITRLRLASALAAALALAGCMTSQAPLFPQTSAIWPLGAGGRYAAYEKKAGRYVRDETFTLKRDGGGYDYVNEKGLITPLTLHPLGPGLFAVQAKAEDGHYDYARLRIAGAVAYLEIADCSKQYPRVLAALGVARGEGALANVKGDCVLDGVTDVRKAFLGLDFGRPTAKGSLLTAVADRVLDASRARGRARVWRSGRGQRARLQSLRLEQHDDRRVEGFVRQHFALVALAARVLHQEGVALANLARRAVAGGHFEDAGERE